MSAQRSRKIRPEIHPQLLAWLGGARDDGRTRTYDDAVVWLAETHGISVHRRAVGRVVRGYSAAAKAAYAEVLREEIQDAVGPALDATRLATRRLRELIRTEDDTGKVAAGLRAHTSALDVLAKLSGVAVPVAVDLTVATPTTDPASLHARLAAAARAAAAAPPGSAGVPDPGADREPASG